MKILLMSKFNDYSEANFRAGTSSKKDNMNIISETLNAQPAILDFLISKLEDFIPSAEEDLNWIFEVRKIITTLLTKAFKWDKIIAHDLLISNPSGNLGVREFLKYLDLLVKNIVYNAPLYKLSPDHNKSLNESQRSDLTEFWVNSIRKLDKATLDSTEEKGLYEKKETVTVLPFMSDPIREFFSNAQYHFLACLAGVDLELKQKSDHSKLNDLEFNLADEKRNLLWGKRAECVKAMRAKDHWEIINFVSHHAKYGDLLVKDLWG